MSDPTRSHEVLDGDIHRMHVQISMVFEASIKILEFNECAIEKKLLSLSHSMINVAEGNEIFNPCQAALGIPRLYKNITVQ
ncbi:hypothetical protein AVEN_147115-1 [Araneus ventricosus]|uniref:Uncharacterized protein n=1 Tax=Araneus ventricosus TaxID=182803 RepID=A0A4Y2JEN9_ARAVE|nr:hypothetical protein AVEN_147115-1 [Araneus ventricosus]